MKNKSLFSRLLDNKKLMLIVSLVLSFMFWIVSSDNTTQTINDVPLNYSLSDSASKELKIFSSSVDKVSVKVSGKRVIIDSLSEEDLIATVDLFGVTEPGTNSYKINVENTGNAAFDVESISPDSVNIMIDKEATKTVNLFGKFSYSPEGYYVENNVPETIEITGPESVVNQVESAYISGSVTSSDASTVTNNFTVRLCDNVDPTAANAMDISAEYITMSYDNVDVSFRFLKLDEDVPFSISYEPSSIKLSSSYFSITPSTISVAGPESLISGENAISDFAIDIGSLSKYKNQIYNETFLIEDVIGSDFINKSQGVESIKVQLDFSSLEIETFDVPSSRIYVRNEPEGYSYTAPTTYPVTIVGTAAVLESLSESNFYVTYDFENVTPSSESPVDVPVNIVVNSSGLCWVYRTSNTVSVMLEKE